MAQKIIDTTTNNGSYIGDPAKTAFGKCNENFTEIYGRDGVNGVRPISNGGQVRLLPQALDRILS